MTLKERCDALLAILVGHDYELATKWWNSPNKSFEERNPIDVPIQKVYDYLSFMAYH